MGIADFCSQTLLLLPTTNGPLTMRANNDARERATDRQWHAHGCARLGMATFALMWPPIELPISN